MIIKNLWLDQSARIRLLGSEQELHWKNVETDGGELIVEIPESLKNSISSGGYAYTLKIQVAN